MLRPTDLYGPVRLLCPLRASLIEEETRRFFHNLTKAWVFAPLLFLHRVYF